ncbi:probable Glycylpeptide N-tetradecanoyltransferase [Saccharomycodes ludwigii]|uniref:Glycylpeptide N-tetradecanoyltransferase n=1 Tax=Saccharomycodes ludwigii TaxID=36035 RepID=A0A376B4L6_9ASCO|nr:hypothetical protein SCDLUD_000221 [Saccharomycodes ludwigii]KAH3902640.1 hypothetical protein SCDLUD_000221 [Saccharomycodes ludwigii]SSD59647.1 probable Glycylpeptide N-tetradecanoyltransferase [Saccharomycodes ludwigii]
MSSNKDQKNEDTSDSNDAPKVVVTSSDADPMKNIQELLKMLAIDPSKLNNRDNEIKPKNFEEYKFWKTQPIVKFDEKVTTEGPVDNSKTVADIPTSPLPLKAIPGFEWYDVDIENDIDELYQLLNENYVEDQDSAFRFDYSKSFLQWALTCPGYKKEWFVGIRVISSKKLVGFISAIPVTLQVRGKILPSVDINFLCVHKKLRAKRLAPVFIKEITRRVNLCNIWQALHTGGVVLPSPVSVCRYAHRPLNWGKMFDVGFTGLPYNATKTQMIAKYTLSKTTTTPGLRRLELKDLDEALELLNKYQSRFKLIQLFNKEEFKHWFLTIENVIYSYVVEDPKTGKITDFISFYTLPFTILNNNNYNSLNVAYLFYYASDSDFNYPDRFDTEATKVLKKRLSQLVNDACIIARSELHMDVFNALTSQDNSLFLKDLKFGPGDGLLNFYLFNYRTFPMNGGCIADQNYAYDEEHRSDIGVVML